EDVFVPVPVVLPYERRYAARRDRDGITPLGARRGREDDLPAGPDLVPLPVDPHAEQSVRSEPARLVEQEDHRAARVGDRARYRLERRIHRQELEAPVSPRAGAGRRELLPVDAPLRLEGVL